MFHLRCEIHVLHVENDIIQHDEKPQHVVSVIFQRMQEQQVSE
jgi:hypothetical protein